MTDDSKDWRRTLDDGTDADGFIVPANWPVPRPADPASTSSQEPDREARVPTDAEVAIALRILAPGDDDNVTLGELRALLPTPPAPGGGDTAWENVAREAVIAARTEAEYEPAPGDGGTDLRAEVYAALEAVECPHVAVSWSCRACAADAVMAALAARDADQGADALAEVRALVDEEEVTAGGPGWVSTTDLRAALARTTPEAGEDR